MNKINKHSNNTNMKSAIYSEAGIGILANTTLLVFRILMCVQGHRPRLTDLPVALLAVIHLLMLVVMGFIATDIFQSWGGWDEITCKSVLFFLRFLRGLSFCATSLLSTLQAITLSPRSSCLAKFKYKSLCYIFCLFVFVSASCSSFGSYLLNYIIATPNLTSSHNLTFITRSCSLSPMSYSVRTTFFTLLTFRDVVLIGLMALSSVYMVTFLCRHKRQSQHLHSTVLSSKASPEQRATQTILVLMSVFVMMSALDSIIAYLRPMNDDPVMYLIQMLVAHSYATICPLVILGTDKEIFNILRSMFGRMVNICIFSEG